MAKIIVLGSHADSLIKFRKEMLASMAQQNEVIACVPNANAQIVQELNDIGVQYVDLKLARTGLNPFADFVTLFKLYKLFKQLHPDLVFTYTSKPVIFGSIAAKLAGVKHSYSMITGLGSYFIFTDLKAKTVKLIMRVLYKTALQCNTKVFFQNPDDRAVFTTSNIFSDPGRTVMINGSGVNVEYFNSLPIPVGATNFILIARLIRDKGIFEYLQAAKIVKNLYPQTRFLLVGWFDNKKHALDRAVLQEYISAGIIEYLGELQDVRPALAMASVFVLPSYREGTPKSVLEAMACGRAIITTDAPGCKETVVEGENGYLIPIRDAQALSDAMKKFLQNPDLAIIMGQKSRKIAETKFDVHMVNKTILNAMELSYA